ncbi:MAG: NADH-quinone oxidoreductase subunit J [Deltaproteobacteria bacterium]|jgi:NADH-quinone oxidoreductase subunit J|nr:NADH-quinone oxidoreductase subunit J [Deltaproteobacteria bacterium]
MVPLFSAEGFSSLIFIFIVIVTVLGAVIATHSVRLIRAVTGLAICCTGLAGLYYYLNSPFVALMEMLIYVGAVCVTIVFAIMLADPKPDVEVGKGSVFTGPLSFALGIILFWGLSTLAGKTPWVFPSARVNDGSLEAVGKALLTNFSMVFELISVVLLIAIIGSLVLARQGRTRTGGES